jgi:hypothetical protein
VPSATNVHDTRLFPHLLRLAQVVGATIGRLYAARATTAPTTAAPACETAAAVRCVVEHDGAWLLANKRLDRRQDRLGRMILALLTAACIFIIANRIHAF